MLRWSPLLLCIVKITVRGGCIPSETSAMPEKCQRLLANCDIHAFTGSETGTQG